MPVLHDKEFISKLLKEHNINENDSRAKGKFFREYYQWDKLSQLYKDGKSIRDLNKMTGLSYDVIRSNLKRVVGNLRSFSNKGRNKFEFHTELFLPNVTNKGAYFLGWIYSDGCVTHNKLNITIQLGDADHLKYLASLVTNKPIRYMEDRVCFEYFSVDLCDKLKSLYNVLPNKSHINFRIPLDRFSKESIPYLLLGLLEGDGNISSSYPSCSLLLSEATWSSLSTHLKEYVNFENVSVRSINKYGLKLIDFRGKSYFSLLYYIYSNTKGIKRLKRKYDLFINQLRRSKNGRTSPYKKLAVKLWDSLSHN